MERNDISRIATELEDLLMNERTMRSHTEPEDDRWKERSDHRPERRLGNWPELRTDNLSEEHLESRIEESLDNRPEERMEARKAPWQSEWTPAEGENLQFVSKPYEPTPEEEAAEADRIRKSLTKQTKRKKHRNKAMIRRNDGLLAAFLVPIVIMLIIFVQRKIFPFGEESFLRTDMYHQYAPFFSEFQYKLRHGGSLLYSWDVGLGVNFSALYAYYLASPLNWLILLCPKKLVIEFMTYMIVFKTGLSGLTMAWYLRKSNRTSDFGIAFFGIFYALSGYMAAYSWNIMWLDCIVLFPLIILGLERLVREGRGLLYCVTLGLSILSNYYISIMTCIFMVFWFVALLILESEMDWEKFVGRTFKFTMYSLLSGGLAGAVLLPEIYALQMTASGDVSFPKTFTQYFSIMDMLARHIGNVESEIGLDHWPNIYCGVAVLMFFVLYLLAKKISMKEKAVYCIMLLFFLASFSMNVLNFIWHGFHYPNSLPCRQSYIYIFLMLTICYRAYVLLDETPRRHVMGAFWGAVIFVIAAQKLVTEDHFHFIVFYVAILFLALYLAMILLYQKGARFRNIAILATLAVVSVEAAVNMTVTSVTTTSRTAYKRDNAAVERLVESVQPGDTFFRFEKVTRKTKNDGAWMHFPSVSLFSSTANADLSAIFKKWGCESSTNAYSITGSTPLIDALLAVKYGIYSEEPMTSGLREYVSEEDGTYLYENKYTLPLGFMVPADFGARWNLQMSNPADVQNSLSDAIDASQVLIPDTDSVADGKKMIFTPSMDGEYYAYVADKKIEKVTVTTATGTRNFSNVDRGYLLDLGFCPAGQDVTLTADGSEPMWADVYRFSEDGLISVHDILNEHPWQLTQSTDTMLSGIVDCAETGFLFTSIPYDEGWSITVDGEKQSADKLLDAFIGIHLSQGKHTIEMHYMPKGLIPGILISIVSVILLVFATVADAILRKKFAAWAGETPDGGDPYVDDEMEEYLEEEQKDPLRYFDKRTK